MQARSMSHSVLGGCPTVCRDQPGWAWCLVPAPRVAWLGSPMGLSTGPFSVESRALGTGLPVG